MASPLISVGYEGRDVEGLVASLTQQRVAVLVDVRLTPLSRKPGLSKKRLASTLAEHGIDYLHLPALGNPKDNRRLKRNLARRRPTRPSRPPRVPTSSRLEL
ncbi:MAG TPA: DUF488 domain-containing protein [Propionibacteriaceae bacterium]|jgi:uncharacterized protein (DUF488 family)